MTGLLWKAGHPEVKDNRSGSLGRLSNLLKRLKRKPELFEEYDMKIKEQIREGIVELAPEEPTGVVLKEIAETSNCV